LSQQDITIGNELIYAFPTRPAMETLLQWKPSSYRDL
jgi:hypothetical protein